MSERKPRGKTAVGTVGGIGAVLLVFVAGYFGFDLGGNSAAGDADSAAPSGTSESSDTCQIAELPEEALETTEDVQSGGPYDFPDNDNSRFGNYEGILPEQDQGYYREYTVITPELDHRGARRIVTGGGTEQDPDVWYYTDDHYESFCEIPDAES